MNNKNTRLLYIIYICLMIFGFFFLSIGTVIFFSEDHSNNIFKETAIKTNATISDIVYNGSSRVSDRYSSKRRVYVEFQTADNEKINTTINLYTSDMYRGKVIELYYDPLNPSDVRLLDSPLGIIFLITFGSIGLIAFIVGALLLRGLIRSKRKRDELIEAGYYVIAEVVDVGRDAYFSINGNSPYLLICKYTENGKNYRFVSRRLLDNPVPFLQDNKIKVWLDRYDYNNYYVDTDNLLGNNN